MTGPSKALHVVLENRLDDLRVLHDAVEHYCWDRGLPRGPVGQLQLALEEHVTNIVRHGSAEEGSAQIAVQVHLRGGDLVAQVRDPGPPFDPMTIPSPDIHQSIDERPLGGLGIHMMRQLTDRLEYRRENNVNVLTLVKRVGPSPK